MFGRISILQHFCSGIIKNQRNSINPIHQHVAFGHYFPKQWTEEYIYKQIDPSKKNIKQIQLVLNRIGKPTGKVLFRFNTAQSMAKYIEKYNQDFIITKHQTHRVILQPFHLRTKELAKYYNERKTKNQVKVKNMDFDITPEELERLAKDYGKVQFIEMQIRPSGLNNGMATVHFSKMKQAEDFSYFIDGLLYKDRKLRAEVINVKPPQHSLKDQFISEPTITLESQEAIFKQFVAAEKKTIKFKAK